MESKNWWCPECGKEVAPRDVTYEENHDPRAGGCGSAVEPGRPALLASKDVSECPRASALLEQIKGLGYSAANDRCTSLCWQLERELADMTSDYLRVHKAFCDVKYPETASGETTRDASLVLRVTTAYEQGYGDGQGHRAKDNPYKPDTNESQAWNIGWQISKQRAEKTSVPLTADPSRIDAEQFREGYDANGSPV